MHVAIGVSESITSTHMKRIGFIIQATMQEPNGVLLQISKQDKYVSNIPPFMVIVAHSERLIACGKRHH